MTLPITTMPLPAEAACDDVVLFGGTFDPPHRAHMELALAARDVSVPGGWLLVVPAARSPHKQGAPAATDADRCEMLRLALLQSDAERCAIWTDEPDRAASSPEPSYFIDTLRRARAFLDDNGHTAARMWFIVGTDQAVAFHRWHEARAIVELATPIVLPRTPIVTRDEMRDAMRSSAFWNDAKLAWWADRLMPLKPIDASATHVRAGASRHMSRADLERAVGPLVAAYIVSHRLYGFGS